MCLRIRGQRELMRSSRLSEAQKTHDRHLTVGALARTDLSMLARVGELNERSAANNSETGANELTS